MPGPVLDHEGKGGDLADPPQPQDVPASVLRQGFAYGVVGGLQLAVDWICFVALTAAGLPTVSANMSGRVFGALLGFWLNGVLTFRSPGGGRLGWVRFGRFMLSWTAMSVLSTLAVYAIHQGIGLRWAWLLKPAVDVVLAGFGFLASRYWIYR